MSKDYSPHLEVQMLPDHSMDGAATAQQVLGGGAVGGRGWRRKVLGEEERDLLCRRQDIQA